MAKLVVKAPGEPLTEWELSPGLHQIGRSPKANFQINHPSVSSSHCQIAVLPSGATIKDLGSTNGTWVNGQRIEESALEPGQRLRLGEVDVSYEAEPVAVPAVRLATTPGVALAVPIPTAEPLPRVSLADFRAVAAPTGSFFEMIPDAFVYPLKHLGFFTLAVGSMLFLAFNILPRLQVFAMTLFFSGETYGRGIGMLFLAALGGLYFGIGTIFNSLCTGYVFAFMQSIITASANGEERMPPYPILESWWYDGVQPYLRLLAILFTCLVPSILCRAYLGPDFQWLTLMAGMLGFTYFFMALLAVSICDNLMAMNPSIVIPSITRIPAEYTVYCVLFFVMTGGLFFAMEYLVEVPFLNRYPIYAALTFEFLFLYVSAVEMRLLGLLYYTGRERLAWKG